MKRGYFGKTATEAMREFRNTSELFFNKLHFWESLRGLEKNLRGQITFRFDSELFDWCACVIAGSRARGIEYSGSDLNVFFFYRGDVREEDIAEVLQERPLYHSKVSVSVVPVRVWGDGSRIVEVLSAEEDYLSLRRIAYMTESAMHKYYADALDTIMKRPRNVMVGKIAEDLQAGNAQAFIKHLERIGQNGEFKPLLGMLAAYVPAEAPNNLVSFGNVA